MKKGKWNYTEDIEYTVILAKLHPIPDKPMYWQNAFAGQERQLVKVVYCVPGHEQTFYIDNSDGSGLLKISKGGGPDSYSAHTSSFDFIEELPEEKWQQPDKKLFEANRLAVDAYYRKVNPEEFERMKRLQDMIANKNYHIDKNGTIVQGKGK